MSSNKGESIREQWQQLCRLEYLTRRQVSLTEQAAEIEAELADLERDLALENQDVARLQGASWTALMASLSGDKDKRLARERVEAEAARQRVLGHRTRRARLNDQLEKVTAELRTVAGARPRYEEAIRQANHSELADVGFRLASVEADLWEYDEAKVAALEAERAVMAVLQALRDIGNASSRNVWRLGFTEALGHAGVSQADQAAWHAQQALEDFTRQLRDIGVATRFELPAADLRWFAELYFDEEGTDASRHEQILRTYQQVEAIVRWAAGMTQHLASRRQVLVSKRTRLRNNWESALAS